MKRKRQLYNNVFGTEQGKEVLADLRKFCYATATTFSNDTNEMIRREGRREVFMQIVNLMKVDYEAWYDYEINVNTNEWGK